MPEPAPPSILKWVGGASLVVGLLGALGGALIGLLVAHSPHAQLSGWGEALSVIGGWALLLALHGLAVGAVAGLVIGMVRRLTASR